MNNRLDSTSWRGARLGVTASRLLLLASMALAVAGVRAADGQNGILTLIPDQVLPPGERLPISKTNDAEKTILLRFDANTLPPGARITAAALSLVAGSNTTAAQPISVNVFPYEATLPSPGKLIARFIDLPSQTTPKDERLTSGLTRNKDFLKAVNEDGVRKFSLRLTTDSTRAISSWYSTVPSVASELRPRLILEFSVPDRSPITQSDGLPAVQSPGAFLPKEDGKNSASYSYVTRAFPKARSFAPAFFNNLVYLLIDNSAKTELHAFDSLGNSVWPQPVVLGNAAEWGQHLLVSEFGRLYIVGAGKIRAYQLDKDNPTVPPTDPLHDSTNPILKPTIPPTLGPDGTLYFVKGLEVYGLNPDLKELWKVTLKDGKTSRITVGPSGRFVYLIGKKDGLVTINAQTGGQLVTVKALPVVPEPFTNPLPNQKDLDVDLDVANPTLHAPVVIGYQDGSENVYVAANSPSSGVLACFINPKGKSWPGDPGEIIPAKAWPKDGLNGLWSQPILDTLPPESDKKANPGKRVYAVSVADGKGTFTAIDCLTGATAAMAPAFSIGESAPFLLDGGNLGSDDAGNRFVWNGAGDKGIYAFGTASSGKLTPVPSGALPVKARLHFGTDRTLFASEVDGDRVLRAIVPQYTLAKPVEIESPTHLQVDGIASGTVTLSAHGSVILGKGFTVKQGAGLRIKKNP